MLDLNTLRLKFRSNTNLNGDISDFVNIHQKGSMLNKATITADYGVNLSLEMEEDLSILNGITISCTRGTDASIRGR
jgi:hypothetical protein